MATVGKAKSRKGLAAGGSLAAALEPTPVAADASGELKSLAVRELLAALGDGDNQTRCAALREVCPCRNNRLRDLALWRAVFDKTLHGGRRERVPAAHAIGTLTEKAKDNAEWRDLLHHLRDELDALMRDTRASRHILGQMKRHGHAHKGAARKNYRRRRRLLDLATARELAEWLNQRLRLAGQRRVAEHDPGLLRLHRWLRHRVTFQPQRRTAEDELLRKAQRYLPGHFANGALAA